MSWTTLTVDTDLARRITAPELTAARSAAIAAGQDDPVPGVLAQAIDEARGYLAARPAGSMGPAGTLPPQVHAAVLDITIWRALTRLNVARLLTDARRQTYADAIALLRDIAAGRVVVEAPATLTTEDLPAVPTPRITKRPCPRLP